MNTQTAPSIDDFLANVAEALRLAMNMRADRPAMRGVVNDVRLSTLAEMEDMLVRMFVRVQGMDHEVAANIAVSYLRTMLERINADPTHSFL